MTPDYITRDEYRDDLQHVEGLIREGFAQMTVRLDAVGTRVRETELRVAVLNDRSDRAEEAAKEAATTAASNTRWAKYIGPLVAMASGLLSGQVK